MTGVGVKTVVGCAAGLSVGWTEVAGEQATSSMAATQKSAIHFGKTTPCLIRRSKIQFDLFTFTPIVPDCVKDWSISAVVKGEIGQEVDLLYDFWRRLIWQGARTANPPAAIDQPYAPENLDVQQIIHAARAYYRKGVVSSYSSITKRNPSLRPKTSGKYCWRAVDGMTWNSPGITGCRK